MNGNSVPINVGYIGAGFVAQAIHLPNLATSPRCRLLAIAEVRDDIREAVGTKFNIERRYRSHHELLEDADIEAVAVSAAYQAQNEIAVDSLRTGRPVFMEKPVALTYADALGLVESERKCRGRLMVGYMKRYDAGNQLGLQLVQELRMSEEIGRPTYMRLRGGGGNWLAGLDPAWSPLESRIPYPEGTQHYPDWLPTEAREGYVAFLQQYTHNINLMRAFANASPGKTTVRAVDFDQDQWTGVVIFETAGLRAVLEAGGARSLSHHAWDEHTQLYFEHGWVRVESPPLLARQAASVEIYRSKPAAEYRRPVPADVFTSAYARELDAFLSGVADNRPFLTSATDAAEDIRIIEDIYRVWFSIPSRTEAQ